VTSKCLFCRIIAKEIPAAIVSENEDCVAFRDINPQAPVHILVIPRQHIASLNDAREASILGQMQLTAAQLAKSEGLSERGYRTVINTNADAGQTVFHIHLHLMGGRAMGWPPG
jgi:histidine triad (HIT) family protein